MKNRTTTVIAGLAMGFEILAFIGAVVVVLLQNSLTFLYGYSFTKAFVFPFSLITMVLCAALYAAFFTLTLKGQTENGKVFAIIIVVAYVLIVLISMFLNFFESVYYANRGLEMLSKISSVKSAVSIITAILGLPSAPLFYIAIGRYTLDPASFTKVPEQGPDAPAPGQDMGSEEFIKY
ncbi:MAG: hypothetical protein J6W85_03075 [Lachnospiraceae bacterium]|nr:hypothetical protein [Lachnospiraceae bacterium]